jgi:hypothetical protein
MVGDTGFHRIMFCRMSIASFDGSIVRISAGEGGFREIFLIQNATNYWVLASIK